MLFVVLNDFTATEYLDVTESFTTDRLKFDYASNRLTDANKFIGVELRQGYLFFCDDDLTYPPTYVQDTIKAIDKYKCIVTYHGKKYPRPFESFYRLERNYRCLGAVLQDAQVDVGGSGVMAWHSDHFKFKYEDCLEPNMADVWVSKAAHEQNVKIMVLPHKADYFKHTSHKENIFATENAKKFVRQTEILKTFLN
jgi:hypothetical protein